MILFRCYSMQIYFCYFLGVLHRCIETFPGILVANPPYPLWTLGILELTCSYFNYDNVFFSFLLLLFLPLSVVWLVDNVSQIFKCYLFCFVFVFYYIFFSYLLSTFQWWFWGRWVWVQYLVCIQPSHSFPVAAFFLGEFGVCWPLALHWSLQLLLFHRFVSVFLLLLLACEYWGSIFLSTQHISW